MIRVLCVDDEPLVRRFLAACLAPHPDFQVVGIVGDTASAMATLRSEAVDVLVLDFQLREARNGLHLLAELETLRAQGVLRVVPTVLFCTGREDAQFIASARSLGAAGVMSKERIPRELAQAVRAVHSGSEWFSVPAKLGVPRTLSAASPAHL